ncbi:MAG: hypothetical protein QOG53_858 [Frankiales bacterium]|nr:hypothetical protein [Frankiales bacterium]
MGIAIVVGAVIVGGLVAMYLSWTAGRLDRLHNRTDAAWASLDAQLVRRAALAAEIAHAAAERGLIKPDDCDRLAAAAQHSLESGRDDRAANENALGHALRGVLDRPAIDALTNDPRLQPLVEALEAAMTKVVMSRRFHATAVEDTVALRGGRAVRWLRLAGSAPFPAYFDIDDTPVPVVTSPVARPR